MYDDNDDEQDAASSFLNGMDCLRNGQVDQSIPWFTQSVKINPYHFEANYNMALALSQLNLFDEALQFYKSSIEIDPVNANAYANLGDLLIKTCRFDEAVKTYSSAIENDPLNPDLYHMRGIALRNLSNFEEELESYEQGLKVDPNHVDILHSKGISLINLGCFEDAIQSFDKVITLDKNHIDARYFKATALSALEQYNEAIQCCQDILAIDPNHVDLAIDPNHVEANHSKGLYYRALNRVEDELQCYNDALILDPNHVETWVDMGLTLSKINRHQEALDCFNHAAAIDPTHYSSNYNRGIENISLQNYTEALECFSHTFRLEQDFSSTDFRRIIPMPDTSIKIICSSDVTRHEKMVAQITNQTNAQCTNIEQLVAHATRIEDQTLWVMLVSVRTGTITLEDLMNNGILTIEMVKPIIIGVLNGLKHVHEVGLIHCNIKPSRIDVCLRSNFPEQVKILDFEACVPINDLPHLMTKQWACPEFISDRAQRKTDLFSTGLVLQKCLISAIRKTKDDSRSTENGLRSVVAKACHIESSQRYDTAEQMLEDFLNAWDADHNKDYDPVHVVTFQ